METKKDIEKAIYEKYSNVIACYYEDVLCGLCVYFWKEDDRYTQTTQFLINKNYDEAADKIIDYIRNQLVGYELLIGVPATNKNAIKYFKSRDIVCTSSIDTRIYNLKPHINHTHNSIEEITESNFEEYAIFHDKYAVPLEMYYNSKNLQNEICHFRVLVFKEEGVIQGSIFAKVGKDVVEILGLFIDNGYKNKGVESILTNEMLMKLYNEFSSVKEIIYFIDEECTNELNSALDAGFKIKDIYKCYKCIL